MSGGRWGYQQHKLEEQAADLTSLVEMVAAMEHILDWGSCGDTCWACAKEHAITVFEAYFDARFDRGTEYWADVAKTYPVCEHR
jgi:hypothetical protein